MLRVTIPVDFYSSPIIIEIEGVDIQARILLEDEQKEHKTAPGSHRRSSGRRAAVHGHGDSRPGLRQPQDEEETEFDDPGLPNPEDIATSFLQAEPPEERAHLDADLKAALASQPQPLEDSQSSLGDETFNDGYGTGLALPDFIAGFLKGIGDRLEVHIRGVEINLDTQVVPEEQSADDGVGRVEPVTLRLSIEDVNIEGLTAHETFAPNAATGMEYVAHTTSGPATLPPGPKPSVVRQGTRAITLKKIQGLLVSDPALFASLSRQSGTPSPVMTHSSRHPNRGESLEQKRFKRSTLEDIGFSEPLSTSGSTYGLRHPENSLESVPSAQEDLRQSIISTDTDRFADAPDEDPQLSLSGLGPSSEHHDGFGDEGYNDSDNGGDPSDGRFDDENLEQSGYSSRPFAEVTPASGPQSQLDMISKTTRSSSSDSSTREEDLTESKLFTHEEAESMYLSAMSEGPSSSPKDLRMPGGWDTSSTREHVVSSRFQSTQVSTQPSSSDPLPSPLEVAGSARSMTPTPSDAKRSPVAPGSGGNDTEDDLSEKGRGSPSSFPQGPRMAKQIMSVTSITMYIPQPQENEAVLSPLSSGFASNWNVADDDMDNPAFSGRTGAFSIYASTRSSTKGFSARRRQEPHPNSSLTKEKPISPPQPPTEFDLGHVRVQVDVTIAKVVGKLSQQLAEAFGKRETVYKPGDNGEPSTADSSVLVGVERLTLSLLERLAGVDVASSRSSHGSTSSELEQEPPHRDILLRSISKKLSVVHKTSKGQSNTDASIGKFTFGYPTENVISFDANLRMRASTRDFLSPANSDIKVSLFKSPESLKIKLATLPIHVSLDLRRFDETFSWFGGFSSILGLGSSIASSPTTPSAKDRPKTSKLIRGVRFESIPPSDVPTTPPFQVKGEARVGGVSVDLVGKECSIKVSTSAFKFLSRPQIIGVSVDHITINGPHLKSGDRTPSIRADIEGTRLEYVDTPTEDDLSRLLSLITPSKNKYDQDDDIMVDTLLRQRRKGPVLRATLDALRGSMLDHRDLKYLPGLGEEVAKLSTVAKYLPEDDRPGVLILTRLREMQFRGMTSAQLGEFQITTKDLDAAHVSLPSLSALGIGSLTVYRNEDEELIGEAKFTSSDIAEASTPMIMARIIGDELEPAIKVKLWKLRVEYRVPTIMAALGLKEDMTAEEVALDLASSVATLTNRRPISPESSKSLSRASTGEKMDSMVKPMKLELIMRDCIIGLNPFHEPCKALVVFTETRFSAGIPKEKDLQAILNINNASILIIDDVENFKIQDEPFPSARRLSTGQANPQIADLCARGFVSVSNIRSATAAINLDKSANGEQNVDIELKDELLLLESCADSTQTLVTILSALKPPTPPSEDIKYRTEIVPVQDMLASLAGEAFVAPREEEESAFDPEFLMSQDDEDMVNDDVPSNSEFLSSLYSPGSISKSVTDSTIEHEMGNLSIESINEDVDDKVLLDSFHEHYKIDSDGPLEFREDHFGSGSVAEGTAHRWDSVKNAYGLTNDYKVPGSPLKVRIRDVHIIWNLFDGYDWQRTRETITKAVREVETKATERRAQRERRSPFEDEGDEDTVIGDFLFNSIYIGIPANRDPRELANMINRNVDDLTSEAESYAATTVTQTTTRPGQSPRVKGKKLKLKRSTHHKMAFELKGVSMDLVVFPLGSGETQSSVDVRVHDLEIFDHVPTSTWKKFATYMHDAGERESGTSMIHLEILNVKPVPDLAASEVVLKVRKAISTRLQHTDEHAGDRSSTPLTCRSGCS